MEYVTYLLLFFMTTTFCLLFLMILGGKVWWFEFRRKMKRGKGYVMVFKFDKSRAIHRDIIKLPEDIKMDEKQLIGSYVTTPVHYDALTGMPALIAIDGKMTTVDFMQLFHNNKILAELMKKNPKLKQQLEALTVDIKNSDGDKTGEKTLLDFVYYANINDEYDSDKAGDLLNSVGVRLYNLGFLRGKNFFNNMLDNKKILLMLGIIILLLLVVGYFVYNSQGMLSDALNSVNATKTAVEATKVAVIGG